MSTSAQWNREGTAVYYHQQNALYEVEIQFGDDGPRLGIPTVLFQGDDYNGRVAMGGSPVDGGRQFLVVGNVGEAALTDPTLIVVESALAEIE